MKPKSSGGVLDSEGLVEVVSSMDQVTQKPINYDIRYGVWVVFEGDIEYKKDAFMSMVSKQMIPENMLVYTKDGT